MQQFMLSAWIFLTNIRTDIAQDTDLPLLGRYPNGTSYDNMDNSSTMHISDLLTIAVNLKKLKCPS